jgi:hypothetical protein
MTVTATVTAELAGARFEFCIPVFLVLGNHTITSLDGQRTKGGTAACYMAVVMRANGEISDEEMS